MFRAHHVRRAYKEKDAAHTVIMFQPENETGCQEIDEERDHCQPANRAWVGNVPGDLMQHLRKHDGRLIAWLAKIWQRNGKKAAGAWPEVFGADVDGQKIFMAYFMAQFVERVAAAGKAVHPLPMFVNDWLGSIESPGGPIGGPDYQVMDIWRVACSSAQAFVPDIYQDNFKQWLAAYDQLDNPILVPEARNDPRAAQQCWYTCFQHNGLLYSPYLLVPREAEQKDVPRCLKQTRLKASYALLKEIDQLILDRQGLAPSELLCFALDQGERPQKVFRSDFQGFSISAQATIEEDKPHHEPREAIPPLAAIMSLGRSDFAIFGTQMQVTFEKKGIRPPMVERGTFYANRWTAGQALPTEKAAGRATVALRGNGDTVDVVRMRFEDQGENTSGHQRTSIKGPRNKAEEE
jgi:hypothetical protein